MRDESRWEALLETTRNASEAAAAEEAELARRRGEPPRPGDLFAHPATAGWGVEWLVLEEAGDGQLVLLPADTHPLAGSEDVEIPAGEPSGPLVLRCGHAVRLGKRALDRAERSGEAAPEVLRRARDKHRRIEAGTLRGEALEREVDEDPEYEDWLAEAVVPACAALAQTAAGERRAPAGDASTRLPARLPWAVAATLATAVLGLSLRSASLNRETRTLIAEVQELRDQTALWSETPDKPFLIGSFGEVDFGSRVRGGPREKLPVPREGPMPLLTVYLEDEIPERESYRVVIVNPESRRRWPPDGEGIEIEFLGEVRVALPLSFLTGDRLEVRLFGETGDGFELLEEQTVRLEHEPPP